MIAGAGLGRRGRARRAARWSRPTPASPERVVAQAAVASRGRRRPRAGRSPRAAEWRRTAAAERAEVLDPRRRVAARAAAGDRRARGPRDREAVARGRRRRVRGDRLPRVLRARRGRARGAPAGCRAAGAELIQPPGERNELRWSPRGVVAVISPWNFPVAIPLGMVAAGAGDRQRGGAQAGRAGAGVRATCSCGAARVRRARRARWRCCPARAPVGAQLVGDPRVHTIAFTGSGPVGLEIVAPRGRDGARAEAPQARGGRDGRQELRDRRLRRRPRRRRARAGEVRVQLRRPEVLGGRARARPRGDPRRRWSSGWRARSRCCTSARRPTPRSTCRR